MRVNIISPTIQEFDGERFYLCGHYFQHKGKRLHVTVWKYHNGEIPKGYHVHHKDQDKSNNQIENLELMLGNLHQSIHASARDEYNHKHINDIRVLAAEWHGSEAGREWHSKHAKETWKNAETHEYVCTMCGKTFKTKNNYSEKWNCFCSNACKSKYRRRIGIDNEQRSCAYCGKAFAVNKYSKQTCCSHECAVKKRWNK